jgi:2-polyprenyl-6-methoxyphenol hydroxylase-like FAD-dependent oxidoreductase
VPSVLISGASIAGPTLAYWLAGNGWETTLVERFAELRDTGQNIDVRGAGREVLRRMGLEEAALAATTGESGTAFVDERGRVVAELPAATGDTDGATAELEILRGELSRLINERVSDRATTMFGDEITGLVDRGDAVEVTFAHGEARAFDLVVVAEGLTSRTRQLVMPDAEVRSLGIYMAYVTIPRTAADDDRWRWFNAGRGRVASLRPDNMGTIRATLSFLGDVRGIEELDPADQALVIRRTFADAGWETGRVLDALAETPFYFDAVGQVRLPRWSKGRIALVGDAAYCASPVSGMGTSLALVGAYVLANELATAPDHATAFERYESRMRPYVDGAQNLPPGTPRLAHPRSRAGVTALRTAMRIVASGPARRLGKLGGRLISPPADAIDLPACPEPALER